jgi:hypothetical protein
MASSDSSRKEVAFLEAARDLAMEMIASIGARELHETVDEDVPKALTHAALLQRSAQI